MRVFELNKYIKNHINRIDLIHDRNFVDSIQKYHRDMISTYKTENNFKKLVNNGNMLNNFNEKWFSIGKESFPYLKEFCGNMSTIFPNTSTVESDFSLINYEKNQYRTSMTDLILEGILQAKQHYILVNLSK